MLNRGQTPMGSKINPEACHAPPDFFVYARSPLGHAMFPRSSSPNRYLIFYAVLTAIAHRCRDDVSRE